MPEKAILPQTHLIRYAPNKQDTWSVFPEMVAFKDPLSLDSLNIGYPSSLECSFLLEVQAHGREIGLEQGWEICGPRKHSGKMFKTWNFIQVMTVIQELLPFPLPCFYLHLKVRLLLNVAFSEWPLTQIICLPLGYNVMHAISKIMFSLNFSFSHNFDIAWNMFLLKFHLVNILHCVRTKPDPRSMKNYADECVLCLLSLSVY